ncbi:hypothetical protein ACIRLA_22185 [Streptomyces sp. NPDC102364]|uniref:hypothetical protein n=1 Tax=Streptomyces sp. NPDC102364 TaxID=3366161 RepID=UPI00381E3CE3
MNPAKPAANLPRKPGRRRFVSPTTERMLRDLFDGWVPAAVIEDAVRQYAIKLGKLDPKTRKKTTS